MNATTLFLAQIIGPVGLVAGLSLLMNKDMMMGMMKSLEKEPLATYVTGMITMVSCIALLLHHNLWGSLSEGIVSFVGWAGVIKGALLMVAPKPLFDLGKTVWKQAMLGGIVWVLAGGYLSYMAYFA